MTEEQNELKKKILIGLGVFLLFFIPSLIAIINKFNYVYEDLDSTDEVRYKKVLYKLDISSDDIEEPTIIYVSEGKIYSSLVNVEDMENFETYISNLENSWS